MEASSAALQLLHTESCGEVDMSIILNISL
jgi:hypothetical protein